MKDLNYVEQRTARAAIAASAAGISLDDGYTFSVDGHLLKANMCGQAISGVPHVVCVKKSNPCPYHTYQTPRRYLVQFGQIYTRRQFMGFTLPHEYVKTIEMIGCYLELGSDQAFPDMPCFRIPDLKDGILYAITQTNRVIIRLQEGDVIARMSIKHRVGDGWPTHEDCSYFLIRNTPKGRAMYTIMCLAFDRPKRNLRQWLKSCFVLKLPAWFKQLPLLKK